MPLFDLIACEIDSILERDGPEGILNADVRVLFESIFESNAHVAKLNSVVLNLDTPEVIAMAGSRDYLLLHSSAHSTWAFTRRRGRVKTVSLTPLLSLSLKLDHSPCFAQRYETSIADNAVFDPTAMLTNQGACHWAAGEVLAKESMSTVHDFQFVGNDGPVYLKVNSKLTGNFEWVFDLKTLKALRHVCVSPGDSNLITMLELLGDVGSPTSIDYILPYVANELHFVRWKAISVITRIDRIVGASLIEAATHDKHPEVRRAARHSLGRQKAA